MSKQDLYDKLDLLGVEIDAISNSGAIDYLINRAAPGQPAAYIVKPYVEFLDRAYHDKTLRDLLNGAELTIPDGIALVWAAAYLYAGRRGIGRFWLTLAQIIFAPRELLWPLPDRAAGINFTWPLLAAARDHHLRVYLIGKESQTGIDRVAALIAAKAEGITIVGARSGRDTTSTYGRVSDTWLAQTTAAIRGTKADLVLVGMGFPLQERVCARLSTQLDHGIFIGEGGTFDYESFGGVQRKAPAWMQRTGLEWLWRLILQPKRLRRQLAIPRFMWRVWRSR